VRICWKLSRVFCTITWSWSIPAPPINCIRITSAKLWGKLFNFILNIPNFHKSSENECGKVFG
jgi:hypothetical protein